MQELWDHRGAVVDYARTDRIAAAMLPPLVRAAAPTREIIGYLPFWKYDSYPYLDYSLLTQINYFSAELDSSGRIVNDHHWPDTPLVDFAHDRGVKVKLCATLSDWGGTYRIDSLLSNPASRQRAIDTLLARVTALGADGVDIDFEPLRTGQRENMVTFMHALATTFRDSLPGALITIAVPADDWSGAWNYDSLAQIVDGLFIMAYDYHWSSGPNAGPVSPLDGFWTNVRISVDDFLTETHNNAAKLILGLPYYGYDWPVVDTTKYAGKTDGEVANAHYYSAVYDMALTYGRRWDDSTSTPWFNYQSDGWRQVWYDDSLSLALKYQLALDQDLSGVGMWALGFDGDRTELWGALADHFTGDYPAAPTGLTAVAGNGWIGLAWSPNSETDFLRYRIYGGTATAPNTQVDSTTGGINDTSKTITNLSNGTTYNYRITAVDSAGSESAYGAEVSATPIDLVASYPFNGNADDESGNGNNGTLIGDTYFIADRFGNAGSALSLTGTGYVELPAGAILDNSYQATIAAWINTKATDTQSRVVIGSGDSRGGLDPFMVKIRNNQVEYIEFLNTINNDHIRLSSSDVSFVLNNDEWYHLSSVLSTTASGSKLEVFINGSLLADTTLTDTISIRYDVPMATFIGSIHGLHPWIGYLDDIRIYNRNLSAVEIDSLYQLGGWLGIADRERRGVPTDFTLHQNYPNPFNPITTIRFDLPVATEVRLAVYNLLGREVARLTNRHLKPGFHQLTWNARDNRGRELPTGMYIVLMATPEFRKSIKMVLLK